VAALLRYGLFVALATVRQLLGGVGLVSLGEVLSDRGGGVCFGRIRPTLRSAGVPPVLYCVPVLLLNGGEASRSDRHHSPVQISARRRVQLVFAGSIAFFTCRLFFVPRAAAARHAPTAVDPADRAALAWLADAVRVDRPGIAWTTSSAAGQAFCCSS